MEKNIKKANPWVCFHVHVCFLFKNSAQTSKLWAPHGVFASQIRNYSKLKYKSKHRVPSEGQRLNRFICGYLSGRLGAWASSAFGPWWRQNWVDVFFVFCTVATLASTSKGLGDGISCIFQYGVILEQKPFANTPDFAHFNRLNSLGKGLEIRVPNFF